MQKLTKVKDVAQTEMYCINKTLVICYSIAVLLGLGGYLSSLSSAPQSPLMMAVWISSCIVPFIVCIIAYLINKESKRIQYFMAFGYLIFYLTSILTETKLIYVYVYIMPVLIILIVCNNIKLIYFISGITVIINIFDMITSWNVVPEDENLARIAMVGICSAFAVFTAKVSYRLTNQKLSQIEKEKQSSENMVRVINDETYKISDEITKLNLNKENLSESIASTTSVVLGINSGMNDAVNSIQKQLEATENIKKLVEDAKQQASGIDTLMKQTDTSVTDGSSHISELSQSADTLKSKNDLILQEITELEKKADEVRNIVTIINGIASQTRLLSLNASIEAARAGEHGRGFSVVAEEINSLSNQTGDSIRQITDIIDLLNNEIMTVKTAIDDMMDANELQNSVIGKVASSFSNIKKSVDEVMNDMTKLTLHIDTVSTHTENIVSDAANVSAVSEEVLASTNEADLICSKNAEIVNTINEIAVALQSGAEALKNREQA